MSSHTAVYCWRTVCITACYHCLFSFAFSSFFNDGTSLSPGISRCCSLLISKSGVEESDQNTDECDDYQQAHDFQRAQLLFGHQPPAEDNADCGQHAGEDAVELLLQDHVSFARLIVEGKAGLDTDPGRGYRADDDSAQGGNCFTDGVADIADKELDCLPDTCFLSVYGSCFI